VAHEPRRSAISEPKGARLVLHGGVVCRTGLRWLLASPMAWRSNPQRIGVPSRNDRSDGVASTGAGCGRSGYRSRTGLV